MLQSDGSSNIIQTLRTSYPRRFRRGMIIPVIGVLLGLPLIGCNPVSESSESPSAIASPVPSSATSDSANLTPPSGAWLMGLPTSDQAILQASWEAYKQRFIQDDGRVIDWEAEGRTVSEGQAYAMLRAVWMDDPETFEKTLTWAEANLQRWQGDRRADALWAWKWGQKPDQTWGTLDENFASDADVDAIAALILASRRWNRPDYLELARTKLDDLWEQAVIDETDTAYLLPGPEDAFRPQPDLLILNPSYWFPSAFRLFAQVDPSHDWMQLVDDSYTVLENAATLSTVGLPSDWMVVNLRTEGVQPIPEQETLSSNYSFDAYRVWWRVALDAQWFGEERAIAFLRQGLNHPKALWQAEQTIPARIDLAGQPLVSYEATAQYAMLYAAFQVVDPAIATQLHAKLLATYQNGIWDNPDAYYVQNLAWFGLAAPVPLPDEFLQSTAVLPSSAMLSPGRALNRVLMF